MILMMIVFIIIMRLFYTKSLVWGSILGVYFGEKRLPWPIQYIPKRD
jgi:hypothetical protein